MPAGVAASGHARAGRHSGRSCMKSWSAMNTPWCSLPIRAARAGKQLQLNLVHVIHAGTGHAAEIWAHFLRLRHRGSVLVLPNRYSGRRPGGMAAATQIARIGVERASAAAGI